MARGSGQVSVVAFLLCLCLCVISYTEHHKRLLSVHDAMLLRERLHRAHVDLDRSKGEAGKFKEEASKFKAELNRLKSSHHSERAFLVETMYKKEEEAEYYKTHNELLLEELKKIEREVLEMNRTEIAHIEKEEAALLDEIVIRDVSEEDAAKIKHAQDLLMKVLNGRAIKLHGHKPIFYNATKIQGDEVYDTEKGQVEEMEEIIYLQGHQHKSDHLPQYWVYQNEGKTHYSHMAMISPLPKRSLFNWIVCWQTAHRHEGTEDQHFRCSLSLDAKTWTTHLEIPLRETGIVWSPVLFLLKETLYLFYSESETCLRPAREDAMGRQFPPRWSPGGTIKYVKSIDGIAWTKSRAILRQSDADFGIPKVIANQPIVTSGGKWVLPWWQEVSQSAEATETCVNQGQGKAGVLISADKGHTWHASKTISSDFTWLIEGTLVELQDKSLLQLFRTVEGAMFSSRSTDEGETWSEAEKFNLPNPNSKFNLIKLDNGDLLVAYNHQSLDRRRINLRVAKDEGETWYNMGSLQPDYIDQEAHWQRWHYPTAIQDAHQSNQVYVVYSCDYMDPENDNHTTGGIRIASLELDSAEDRFTDDRLILPMQEFDPYNDTLII